MKVAFFTIWHEGFEKEFGGLARALLDRGDQVMACYDSTLSPTNSRVQFNRCRWTGFEFGDLEAFEPDRVVIFNSRQDAALAASLELKRKYPRKVLHAELGWLPQKDNIYLDWEGNGGWSRLSKAGAYNIDDSALDALRELYVPEVIPSTVPKDFILVPLQLEKDTSILHDSQRIKTMFSLVGFVKKNFGDYPIIVRTHPICKTAFGFDGVTTISDGISTRALSAHARAIVGINSTSLIEALIYSKPVLALGENVASNKGVFYEGPDAFYMPRKLLEFKVDKDKVDRVLTHLLSSQFSSINTPEHILFKYF
jgi:hypothetical protein